MLFSRRVLHNSCAGLRSARISRQNSITIAKSESYWTTDPKECVKIRFDSSIQGSGPALRVIDLFQNTVKKHGDRPAVAFKDLNVSNGQATWTTWSWSQYWDKCASFAKSIIHLDIKPHRVVNILGFNSAAWLAASNGAILAGAIPAGIYTTNSPEACEYIGKHSQVELLVVENNSQLEKYFPFVNALTSLRAVVMYAEAPSDMALRVIDRHCPIHTFESFLELGKDIPDSLLQERFDGIEPGHCASIIYTSGTTGPPKGAMLSHDNITWSTKTINDYFTPFDCTERYVSYLPLSHISAQLVDIYSPMYLGACSYMAQPDALKGSLVETLKEVRPTVFFGVPRVWEKMAEKMQSLGRGATGVKKVVSTWAKQQGLLHNKNQVYGASGASPMLFPVADRVVLSKVREALGLDKTKAYYTGSAPISSEIVDYFSSLNIPIYEGFGMTECVGAYTLNKAGAWKVGTCGRPLPGTETKIDAVTGELMFRGRNVFMGYMQSQQETESAFDSEGFMRTGDQATLDEDNDPNIPSPSGFLKITGRLKEILITAGGENIAPLVIEFAMKSSIPAISNCIVVGDQRKYLTMLITLKCEVDVTTNTPTNNLIDDSLLVSKQIGSSALTVSDAIQDPKWSKYLLEGLEKGNMHAISHAQRVQKYRILPTDLSENHGFLTPTMKVKRKAVLEKYKHLIDDMYIEE